MNTVKNQAANDLAAYKLATAAMRQKMAAVPLVDEQEIVPVNGKIRAVLNGEPIPRDR